MAVKYFKYDGFKEWYMLDGDANGKGFRFQMDGVQNRNGYFVFEKRTADFISAGLLTGHVVEISREEYLEGLLMYLLWVQEALAGIQGILNRNAA